VYFIEPEASLTCWREPAKCQYPESQNRACALPSDLTLNLPTTTIVAQSFNIIKWQLKFNPVA